MKKKIANVVEIALFVFIYVLLCLPLLRIGPTGSLRPVELSIPASPMGLSTKGSVYMISIIFAVNVIMCLFSVFSKKVYRDGKMHIIMPVILLFYSFNIPTGCDVGDIFGEWVVVENRFPSGLCGICMICIIAISIIKRSPLIVGLPKVEVHNASTNADELQKYKNLLDAGAITQEEFEAKKKQLLGL